MEAFKEYVGILLDRTAGSFPGCATFIANFNKAGAIRNCQFAYRKYWRNGAGPCSNGCLRGFEGGAELLDTQDSFRIWKFDQLSC